ncbi:hypothetical protein ACFLU3_05290, partial [Chloroflexota bacterium]
MDGTTYTANKAVVSTIDIHKTFLDYVGKENLESNFIDMCNAWQWENWSLLDTHLALDKPPQFTCAQSNSDINKAFMYVLGYDSCDELIHEWDLMATGELPEKARYIATFPSVHDPYQAPPGRASGLLSQMAPYDLKDGGPDKWLNFKYSRELVAYQRKTLERYAPNMATDAMIPTHLPNTGFSPTRSAASSLVGASVQGFTRFFAD